VRHHGKELALTLREFDLLAFLLRRPRQVFSREELIKAVWEWDFGDLSTVTVHVRRLREKIEEDPTAPQLLKTVWGVGYRFDPPASDGDGQGPPDGPPGEPEGSRGER
jgi:DNA-binding response OmpR family regulator